MFQSRMNSGLVSRIRFNLGYLGGDGLFQSRMNSGLVSRLEKRATRRRVHSCFNPA